MNPNIPYYAKLHLKKKKNLVFYKHISEIKLTHGGWTTKQVMIYLTRSNWWVQCVLNSPVSFYHKENIWYVKHCLNVYLFSETIKKIMFGCAVVFSSPFLTLMLWFVCEFVFLVVSRSNCSAWLQCWSNGELGSGHIQGDSSTLRPHWVFHGKQRESYNSHLPWTCAHGWLYSNASTKWFLSCLPIFSI